MKLFSANLDSLSELYFTELAKAADLEEAIIKALPRMIRKASDPDLKAAFKAHLDETRVHFQKITRLVHDSDSQTCKVIHALVAEVEDIMQDVPDPAVMDVALIGSAQQVEHHEIAIYGTLKAWAQLLGRTEDVAVLESIEQDEKHADVLLSQISDRVNVGAPAVIAA